MKKLLLSAALSMATVAGFAQGTMIFYNYSPNVFVAPIFAPDPAASTVSLHGQSASGFTTAIVPAGTVVYNGSALQGTGYTLQVWTGDKSADLAPVYTTSFRTASGNKLPAGLVSGSTSVAFAGVLGGSQGVYEVRVWDNKGGTLNTWADAQTAYTAGTIALGSSGVVTSQALGGTDAGGGLHPVSPASTDWTSFNIAYAAVPEPGTLALLGLGAAGMLIFRRRK
jgi:hypothetical protein